MQLSESVSPVATKGELRSFQRSQSKWLASRKKYRMLLPIPQIKNAEIALNDSNKSCSVINDYKENLGEVSLRDRNEILIQRLESFYKQHCPSKLDNVEKLVKKYKDAESHKIDELFLKLNNKYISISSKFPMPELRKDTNPKCFLDIQIGGGTSVNVHKIVVQLYDHETPLAVENFRCLCTGEKGIGRSGKPLHFKNSKFHRIIPSFMLQAGDFTKGDGTGGESIYVGTIHGDMWGKFKDEKFLAHSRRGLLSYANNGPNRNSSQFFITLRATPHLDGKHVVFGEVIEGFEALDVIAVVDRDKSDKPSINNEVIIGNCGQIVDKQSHGPIVAGTLKFEKNGLFGKNDLPLKQSLSTEIPQTGLKGNVLSCDFSRKEDKSFSISLKIKSDNSVETKNDPNLFSSNCVGRVKASACPHNSLSRMIECKEKKGSEDSLSTAAPKQIKASLTNMASTKAHSTASISPSSKVNDDALSQELRSDDRKVIKKGSNPFSSFSFGKVETPTWPSKTKQDNMEKNEDKDSGCNVESKEKKSDEDSSVKEVSGTNASMPSTSNSASVAFSSLPTADQKPATVSLTNTASTKAHSTESISPKAASKVNDNTLSQLNVTGSANRKVTKKASNPFSSFTFGKVETPTWPSKNDPDNMEKNENNDRGNNLESNEMKSGEESSVKQVNDANASMLTTSNSAGVAFPPLSTVAPKPVKASLMNTASTKSYTTASISPKAASKVNDNALSQVKVPGSADRKVTKKASNPFSSFTFGEVEAPTWPSKTESENRKKNEDNESGNNLESTENGEDSLVKQVNDANDMNEIMPTSSISAGVAFPSTVAPKLVTASFTNTASTKAYSTVLIAPKARSKVNDNTLSKLKATGSADRKVTKKASNPLSSFTFGEVEAPTWPSKSEVDNMEKDEDKDGGNNLEIKEKKSDEDSSVKQGNDTNASMPVTSNAASVAFSPLSTGDPKPVTAPLRNTASLPSKSEPDNIGKNEDNDSGNNLETKEKKSDEDSSVKQVNDTNASMPTTSISASVAISPLSTGNQKPVTASLTNTASTNTHSTESISPKGTSKVNDNALSQLKATGSADRKVTKKASNPFSSFTFGGIETPTWPSSKSEPDSMEKNENNDSGNNLENNEKKSDEDFSVKPLNDTDASMRTTSISAGDVTPPLSTAAPKSGTVSFTDTASTKPASTVFMSRKATSKLNDNALSQGRVVRSNDKKASNPFSSFTFGKVEAPTWPSKSDPDNMEKIEKNDRGNDLESTEKHDGEDSFVKQVNDTKASMLSTCDSAGISFPPLSTVAPKPVIASITHATSTKSHSTASISPKAASKVNDNAFAQVKVAGSADRKVTKKASNPFSSFTFGKIETPTWPSKSEPDSMEKNENNDSGNNLENNEKKSDEDFSVKPLNDTDASMRTTSISAGDVTPPLLTAAPKSGTVSITDTASTKPASTVFMSRKATSKVNDNALSQGKVVRSNDKIASNPFSSFTFGKVEAPTWPSKSDSDNMEKNENNDSVNNLDSNEKNDGEDSLVKQGNDTKASMPTTSNSSGFLFPPLSSADPKPITASFRPNTHSTASISPKARSKVNDNALSQVKVPGSDDREITKKASNPFSSFTFGKVEAPTWPSKSEPDNMEKNENNDSGNNIESNEKHDGEHSLVKQGNDTNASMLPTSNSAGVAFPPLSTVAPKLVTASLTNTASTKSHSPASISPKASSIVWNEESKDTLVSKFLVSGNSIGSDVVDIDVDNVMMNSNNASLSSTNAMLVQRTFTGENVFMNSSSSSEDETCKCSFPFLLSPLSKERRSSFEEISQSLANDFRSRLKSVIAINNSKNVYDEGCMGIFKFNEESYGTVLRSILHQLIVHSKWTKTLERINAVKGEVTLWVVGPDPSGRVWKCLPIHVACKNNPPTEVIKSLLEAYPESASFEDNLQSLPLHYACAHGATFDVISILTDYCPNAVKSRNRDGLTPLELFSSTCDETDFSQPGNKEKELIGKHLISKSISSDNA